jgi:hypothetical protein
VADSDDAYARLFREYVPDAVLEGSGSFLVEGSAPESEVGKAMGQATTCDHFLLERIVERPGHRGWFVVVDGRGRVRWRFRERPDPAFRRASVATLLRRPALGRP